MKNIQYSIRWLYGSMLFEFMISFRDVKTKEFFAHLKFLLKREFTLHSGVKEKPNLF